MHIHQVKCGQLRVLNAGFPFVRFSFCRLEPSECIFPFGRGLVPCASSLCYFVWCTRFQPATQIFVKICRSISVSFCTSCGLCSCSQSLTPRPGGSFWFSTHCRSRDTCATCRRSLRIFFPSDEWPHVAITSRQKQE